MVMADFYDFNATFWLSMTTMTFGFLGGALTYALRSKCSSIRCCGGCIEIIRDVELEADLEEGQQNRIMENNPMPTSNTMVPMGPIGQIGPMNPVDHMNPVNSMRQMDSESMTRGAYSWQNSPMPSRRQSRIDKAVADAVKKVTYIEAMAASENYETQSHNSKLENLVTLSKPNMLRRNSEESV